jgi:hypothetical protein
MLLPLGGVLFRQRRHLPTFALAAVVALCVDSTLSGVLTYPLSQILGFWVLSWLLSLLPSVVHQQSDDSIAQGTAQGIKSQLKDQAVARPRLSWQPIFKVMTVIALIAMLAVHGSDFICVDCTSVDMENAPRFWQYGRALHLTPADPDIPASPEPPKEL